MRSAWRWPSGCSTRGWATRIVDHYTYVIAGDGCLMEGISQEAISLAGHLKLNKLIVLFDDNPISIDGPTSLAVVGRPGRALRRRRAGPRMRIDGHDPAAIAAAIEAARRSDKPTLIACKTIIGYGAPTKQGKASTHGEPLGADEIKGAREKLGWAHAPFEVPADVLAAWRAAGARGACAAQGLGAARRQARCRRARAARRSDRRGGAARRMADGDRRDQGRVRRDAAQDRDARLLAEGARAARAGAAGLIGGSADLTGSNGTRTKHHTPVARRRASAATTSTTACASTAWRRP